MLSVGVAKDFHLTSNGSKLGKEGAKRRGSDLERAKNFFLDLYATMQRPNGIRFGVESTYRG